MPSPATANEQDGFVSTVLFLSKAGVCQQAPGLFIPRRRVVADLHQEKTIIGHDILVLRVGNRRRCFHGTAAHLKKKKKPPPF